MNHQKERMQMAGASVVSGALSASAEWAAVDWRLVERQVRRLQARIAQAEKTGKAGKVKALQRILSHSFSAKLWATRRVVVNKGRRSPGVNVVRYAADFLVTARTPEILNEKVIPAKETFLAERGLELSEEKSKVTDIETGFDCLGATIRKYDGKLLMTPSRKRVKGFLDSIRGTIKAHAGGAFRELTRLLNPRIRGRASYSRNIVSSRVFTKVDSAIFDAMVRWMRRRHPRKGLSWLRTRYFRSSGHRQWIITAATWKADSSVSYSDLFQASSVPIRRHVKVQAAATAFNPAFRDYFQKLRKTRTQTKAADRTGSFQASAAARRSRQHQPGRVTAASGKA